MKLMQGLPAQRAREKRGGVLVMSLVAVGVVASLSVGYLHLSASVTRRQVGASDTKLAFYLAEAGLAESYSGIMVGRTGAIGSESDPAVMGEGLLWVEATELDADHVALEAIGMARSGQARLGMVVRRGTANLGGLGIFSESDVTVPDGSTIDGYSSIEGTYAEQVVADPTAVEEGTVRSNGNITVVGGRSGTTIAGDVFAGPAGTVVLDGSPTITGNQGTSAGIVQLDAVQVPTTTMFAGVDQPAGTALVVPSGTFGAAYLNLAADAEVILQGPMTLVLNGLQLAAGAELTFDTTNGEVELFVSNILDLDPGSVLTNTDEDATQVTVNVAGDAAVTLEGTTTFSGLIYAPEATVTVGSDFELFGGLVAEELALAAGVSLHHDRALIESGAEDSLPKTISWRIIEIPEGAPDSVNVDPFDRLGVDPTTCEPPMDAHEDQLIGIVYYDNLAAQQSYSGLESAFDWGDVRSVIQFKRTGGLIEDDIVERAVDGALGFLTGK